jgi:hypothetical protein
MLEALKIWYVQDLIPDQPLKDEKARPGNYPRGLVYDTGTGLLKRLV